MAERIAQDARGSLKTEDAVIRYAATFHDEVEELVDVEEVSEEDRKAQVALRRWRCSCAARPG